MDMDTSTQLIALQAHIRSVSHLHDRLRALRKIPSVLLQPHTPNPSSSPILHQFDQLKAFGESLYSDESQTALRSAIDSEKADKTDLNTNCRRHIRRRRRPPSPEPPKPYLSSPRLTSSLFPETTVDLLGLEGLPDFIRDYNGTHQSKLHIWTRARPPPNLPHPIIVRFTVPDVLTIFITLDHVPALVIETVTAFGPRETKPPHSQSEYKVFRDLSQQLGKMLQSCPEVSFQVFVGLLNSYEGVFVDRCSICQRVLSMEDHVPPVARIWTVVEDIECWSPRHPNCLRG